MVGGIQANPTAAQQLASFTPPIHMPVSESRATLADEEEEDETLVVTVTDPAERAVAEDGDDGVKVEATLTF